MDNITLLSAKDLMDRLVSLIPPGWKDYPPEKRQEMSDTMEEIRRRLLAQDYDRYQVGAFVEECVEALVNGVFDGFRHPVGGTGGVFYSQRPLNVCYNNGANLGQFLGRTARVKDKYRGKGRDNMPPLLPSKTEPDNEEDD